MLTLASYTPAEAAKISGVNVALQRDWRRRGILPRREGHARYSPFEVAELMALNAFAVQGVGPQKFTPIATMLAAGIVDAAMDRPEAYAGPLDLVVNEDDRDWLLEWESGAKEFKNWRWDYDLTNWRIRAVKRRVNQWCGHDQNAIRSCFVQWADGSFAFYHSPITPYETIDEDDPRRSGAVLILDLAGLGRTFVQRAPGFVELDVEALKETNARSRLFDRVEEIRKRLSSGREDGRDLDAVRAGR